MQTILKHISQVKAGDTILYRGEIKTLCQSNIKHGGFMGKTIWGDCYKLGYEKVTVVTKIN